MKLLRTLTQRWKNKMPQFFRNICWTCSLISGTAIAVNEAMLLHGATPDQWWNDIYPYLVGVPAGAAFVAKFTQKYNGQPISEHTN